MVFNHVQSFHRKLLTLILHMQKKIWVVEKLFPIATKLSKINTNKKAKSISTCDCEGRYFIIQTLIDALVFLIKKHYFAIGN